MRTNAAVASSLCNILMDLENIPSRRVRTDPNTDSEVGVLGAANSRVFWGG
jgi:hypothetical protein